VTGHAGVQVRKGASGPVAGVVKKQHTQAHTGLEQINLIESQHWFVTTEQDEQDCLQSYQTGSRENNSIQKAFHIITDVPVLVKSWLEDGSMSRHLRSIPNAGSLFAFFNML
jgi:hypothetical protein